MISANEPVAAQHASEISQSSFSVRWHVPGGAPATLRSWKKLWDHPEPYVIGFDDNDGERRVTVNPALPAIPTGIQVALVRRMLLIDERGMVVPSPLTENIQLRVLQERDQRFFEFRLRRTRLFAGEAGGLQAIAPGDLAFLTFSSKGIDSFDSRRPGEAARPGDVLNGCRMCHDQATAPDPVDTEFAPSAETTVAAGLASSALESLVHAGCRRCGQKSATFRLGVFLQGLWLSNPW